MQVQLPLIRHLDPVQASFSVSLGLKLFFIRQSLNSPIQDIIVLLREGCPDMEALHVPGPLLPGLLCPHHLPPFHDLGREGVIEFLTGAFHRSGGIAFLPRPDEVRCGGMRRGERDLGRACVIESPTGEL